MKNHEQFFLLLKVSCYHKYLQSEEMRLIIPPTNFLKTELPYHKDSIIVFKNTY